MLREEIKMKLSLVLPTSSDILPRRSDPGVVRDPELKFISAEHISFSKNCLAGLGTFKQALPLPAEFPCQ